MSKSTVGMWLYENGGGLAIQEKMIAQLRERDIDVIPGLNLAHATAQNGQITCHDVIMENLDTFFSYNAGKQTQYQVYLYDALDDAIPCVNNFKAFTLSEDKFFTAHRLAQSGIRTPDYRVFPRKEKDFFKKTIRAWGGHMVYKPTDGWGGMGIVKIESERALDMLIPFLDQTNTPQFYVERFIEYDMTDYRIDVVDGHYVGCYGRKAPADDWKTNVTSGGTVTAREPEDEVVELAIKAAALTGLEIAGVDIIYDLEHEEYVVLEVNGIPAFATPEQEKMGINFNQRKIDKIVDLIERKAIEHRLKTNKD